MRVAVTGAAGSIGRVLVRGLRTAGHEVVGIDVVDMVDDPDHVMGDLLDAEVLDEAFAGCDAVAHLAAIAYETDFEAALTTHVRLTHAVLEAMRRHRVGRIVYASSNHAVGFTPRAESEMVDERVRPRPDTFYGLGKVAAEGLCSLYHDRFGIAAACLRIGSFKPEPESRRNLATWLSPEDAVRLVAACLTTPDLGFAIVYGISANTRAWWDLTSARALGYEPRDDAERWAAEIEATPADDTDAVDARHVGGDFPYLPLGLEETPST